jgi:hypothetical protein
MQRAGSKGHTYVTLIRTLNRREKGIHLKCYEVVTPPARLRTNVYVYTRDWRVEINVKLKMLLQNICYIQHNTKERHYLL